MSGYGIKVSDILGRRCTAHYIGPDYLVTYNDDHGFIVQAELVDPLVFKLRYFTKKAQFEEEDLDEYYYEPGSTSGFSVYSEPPSGEVEDEVSTSDVLQQMITETDQKMKELFAETDQVASQLVNEYKRNQVRPSTLANVATSFIRFRPVLQYLSNIMALLSTKTIISKTPRSGRGEQVLNMFKTAYNLVLGAFYEQLRKDVLVHLVKSYLVTGGTGDITKFLNSLKSLILTLFNKNGVNLKPGNDIALDQLMHDYVEPAIVRTITDKIIPAFVGGQKSKRVQSAIALAVNELLNPSKEQYIELKPGKLVPNDIGTQLHKIITNYVQSIQDIDNKKADVKREIENYFSGNGISFVSQDAFDKWYDGVLKPNLAEALDIGTLMQYEDPQKQILDAFDAQILLAAPVKEAIDTFFRDQTSKLFKRKEQRPVPYTEERERKILQDTRDEMVKIYNKFKGSGIISDETVATILDNLFRSYYGEDYLKRVDENEIRSYARKIKESAARVVDWIHRLLSSFPTLDTIYAMATYLWVNFLDRIYSGLDRIEPPEVRERIKEMISIIKWSMKKIGSVITVAKDRYVYLGTDGDQVLLANYDELLNDGAAELIVSSGSFDFEDTNDQIEETLVECPVSGMVVRRAMLCSSCPYGLDYPSCSTCLYGDLEKEAQLKSKTPKVVITKNAVIDNLLDGVSFKPEEKQIKTADGPILVYDCVMHRKTGELGVVVEKRVDGSLKVVWASTCKETPVWEQEIVKVDEESLQI
jgi:hypothetical protein